MLRLQGPRQEVWHGVYWYNDPALVRQRITKPVYCYSGSGDISYSAGKNVSLCASQKLQACFKDFQKKLSKKYTVHTYFVYKNGQ